MQQQTHSPFTFPLLILRVAPPFEMIVSLPFKRPYREINSIVTPVIKRAEDAKSLHHSD